MQTSDKLFFEQLFADQFKMNLAPINNRLDGIDKRLDGIDGRLDGIDKRLDDIDGRLDRVEQRLDIRCNKLESMINSLSDVQHQMGAELNDKIDTLARATARSFKELQPFGTSVPRLA